MLSIKPSEAEDYKGAKKPSSAKNAGMRQMVNIVSWGGELLEIHIVGSGSSTKLAIKTP